MIKIPFFNTYIHPSAHTEVASLLDTTFLSEGEIVRRFERQLENDLGLKNCVALNSGTSALHLALAQAGIGEGDEVIIPAQTFVATGLVVLYQKAKPVFADIDYSTGNISVESVRSKITSRTKALIIVHWGGYPCNLTELGALAKNHNLALIEDAAHALGATYKNQAIGSISDYTCFSFQAIKHLTTGDGGAVCTSNPDNYRDTITRRWFGIDRATTKVNELGERSYNITDVGYKYHMNNYSAALGIANLRDFNTRINHRAAIAGFYREQLRQVPGVELFEDNHDRRSAHWLFGFHVQNRTGFIRSLKLQGIDTSVVHQRIDRNSVFGENLNDLPNQTKFDETQIHIPIHDGIDQERAEYIIDIIRKGW